MITLTTHLPLPHQTKQNLTKNKYNNNPKSETCIIQLSMSRCGVLVRRVPVLWKTSWHVLSLREWQLVWLQLLSNGCLQVRWLSGRKIKVIIVWQLFSALTPHSLWRKISKKPASLPPHPTTASCLLLLSPKSMLNSYFCSFEQHHPSLPKVSFIVHTFLHYVSLTFYTPPMSSLSVW